MHERAATGAAMRSGHAVLTPSARVVLGLAFAVVVSALLGLWVGRGGALDFSPESLLLRMRAARVVVAFLCGGALSIAGCVVQTIFRNPLASPELLGTSSGAMLGAHVALLISVLTLGGGATAGVLPEMLIPIGAVLGAVLSLGALLTVLSYRRDPLALILTGYALSSLFLGVSSFLSNLTRSSYEVNAAFSVLAQGDISATGPRQVMLMLLMALFGSAPLLLHADTLDVMLTGEQEARTLGLDVSHVRGDLVLWVAVLTAGATAVGGGVGFVGLIVPHALRPWVGQRHRYLLPCAFLAGGGLVVLCDVCCRIIPVPQGIPLGVLTHLIGAPIFLRMLFTQLQMHTDHD